MTNLSPAAQAVVDAIEKFDWESDHFTREDIWMLSREVTAAALRAAAIYSYCPMDRQRLAAIADELENQ